MWRERKYSWGSGERIDLVCTIEMSILHLLPRFARDRDRIRTVCAAPHGNRLTWKNSGLNTGARIVPLGSRRADTTPHG
jgi:hypothetical protein